MEETDWETLANDIMTWCSELGFAAAGITDVNLGDHEGHLENWLGNNFHGEMDYMSRHGELRSKPAQLHPGTQSVITVRLDYLEKEPDPWEVIASTKRAYVSRYALGRDYHKVIRGKLKKLVTRIDAAIKESNQPDFSARVFTDSAPLLEKALAEKAGLGWIGKNTLLINERAGSWYFLGEVLTNLPLPPTASLQENRCGSCSACLEICPTDAIVAPYQLDARRCISYLTIEHRGSIPVEFRQPMGNRIFGCDDCQLVCPWNRYAGSNQESDFKPRHSLDTASLVELFSWKEDEFLKKTEGSPIRRTGYQGWLRNLSVALGNSEKSIDLTRALTDRKGYSSIVDEHIDWALTQHARSD